MTAPSSGADLRPYSDEVDHPDPGAIRDGMRLIAGAVPTWTGLDKPTVAAVNGIAVGGGANLALVCDRLVMREDAGSGRPRLEAAWSPTWAGRTSCPGSAAGPGRPAGDRRRSAPSSEKENA